jgi:hypothetical protein
MRRKGGWFGESHRHYLARYGVKTAHRYNVELTFTQSVMSAIERAQAERKAREAGKQAERLRAIAGQAAAVPQAPALTSGEMAQARLEAFQILPKDIGRKIEELDVQSKYLDSVREKLLREDVELTQVEKNALMERLDKLKKFTDNIQSVEQDKYAGYENVGKNPRALELWDALTKGKMIESGVGHSPEEIKALEAEGTVVINGQKDVKLLNFVKMARESVAAEKKAYDVGQEVEELTRIASNAPLKEVVEPKIESVPAWRRPFMRGK